MVTMANMQGHNRQLLMREQQGQGYQTHLDCITEQHAEEGNKVSTRSSSPIQRTVLVQPSLSCADRSFDLSTALPCSSPAVHAVLTAPCKLGPSRRL